MKQTLKIACLAILAFAATNPLHAQKALSFEDVMKFEDIKASGISDKGNWVFYNVMPDRGDGYAVFKQVAGSAEFKVELGGGAAVSKNERWGAALKKVPLAVQLREKKDAPKQSLTVLSLQNGTENEYKEVQRFRFSENGSWLAVTHYQTKEIEDLKSKNKKLGTPLTIVNLENNREYELPFVADAVFDSLSNFLAYSVVDTNGAQNGVYIFDLKAGSQKQIEAAEHGYYANLTWDKKRGRLAFTASVLDTAFYDSDAILKLWDGKTVQALVMPDEPGAGWALRSNNALRFTHDGNRLFFGLMSQAMVDADAAGQKKEKNNDEEIDIYDIDAIIGDRGMDIWHNDDPLIKPQEKITWNRRKNQLYTSVYHLDKKKWVQLADENVPVIRISQNPGTVLASSNIPYQKEITWDGTYNDWYTVDLNTGNRTLFATHLGGFGNLMQLSPEGNYAAFYREKEWFLYNVKNKTTVSLTGSLTVPFYNEDHDTPADPNGYGVAGWLRKDEAVLIYDKFDIWRFDTKNQKATNLTNGEGRKTADTFRIRRPGNEDAIAANEVLLLTSYNDLEKNYGFYSVRADRPGVTKLLKEDKKFTLVAKAENSDRLLYKREAYDEYPNLWVSDNAAFSRTQKVSRLHEDLKQKWNWGKAELIDWLSIDGDFTQGVVIKPDDYDPNKRYPVFIYYYEMFSSRLHDFNVPVTDDRPTLAQYVSDGYVVFLPDIRYQTGRPGMSALKFLLPGVQKLIETGIADKDKIGLHGHSWSGYESAYIVTQSNMFAATVAGAPVGNMTSAYSGIRWGTGMARQFQYEKTQSRIGETLVQSPQKYIENSPVFYADRIDTPLLIMHGDIDDAVPWYQSIEIYLGMRRYNKNIIFLHYHDEPHHLMKFPNKLDYAIRMKEYMDYYVRGIGEPEWILKGEAYTGR